jgi:magnesium chelatase family protein
MLATVSSATLVGVDGHPVTVEVHVSNGLPGFWVVGLPDTSCREARDRVRAAIISSGFTWPQKRVTVNLAPSGLRKAGPGLDIAIALGVMAADGQLQPRSLESLAFIGELGLDGSLRRVAGILPLVAAVQEPTVVVAPACAPEACFLGRSTVRAVPRLSDLVRVLKTGSAWPALPAAAAAEDEPPAPDLAEVRGQPFGRQALEIAAAGGHHLLMVGPAGAGKTMLARRLPGILPPLSRAEALEVAKIHSAAGLELTAGTLSVRPPFRSPHHSASAVSLIGGGGARLRPGEISCAHRGVLFLDELAEFPGYVLDNLRQPLEEGRVVVCRASASVVFPARFMLVGAMNACRCGADGSPGSCRCPDVARARYVAGISGPLLDRFDLRIRVRRPDVEALLGAREGRNWQASAKAVATEPSAVVAARVLQARRRAQESRGVGCNAQVLSSRLEQVAPLSGGARRLLERRLRDGRLSARGLDRARRVALTVADLAGHDGPLREEHVLLALALREPEPFGSEMATMPERSSGAGVRRDGPAGEESDAGAPPQYGPALSPMPRPILGPVLGLVRP